MLHRNMLRYMFPYINLIQTLSDIFTSIKIDFTGIFGIFKTILKSKENKLQLFYSIFDEKHQIMISAKFLRAEGSIANFLMHSSYLFSFSSINHNTCS